MNTQKEQKVKGAQASDINQDKVQSSVSNATIGDYHTAPKYMKDNEHITHGYRINFDSPKKIIRSLFMLHNESVNIWSHCVAAIIICICIISFAFIIDNKPIMEDLQTYRKEIANSFEHYTNALDNLTLIQDMKNMRDKTQVQLQQVRHNTIQSLGVFTTKLNKNMENIQILLETEVQTLKSSMRANLRSNLQKLQMMKNDFETIIAPAVLNQINSLNNSYINSIKQQIVIIKQQIDSDEFNYLDIHGTPNPHHVSKWPLMVFLGSALICLMCSTLFHLFYPMSSKSYTIFSRFDYAGISILIAGSSFPALYYGMYCYIEVAIFYGIITMSLAISIFTLSVFEWMHRPEHVHFKAAIYGGFGLFNIFPISHLLINDFFFNQNDGFSFFSSLPYYIMIGVSYLFGLYIYTIRCPQRHYPGRFNLCGHSHQIWHMFVVLGIVFTYLGSIQNFQMRKNNACPVPAL